MTRILLIPFLLILFSMAVDMSAQILGAEDIDSLLNNKRVYNSVSIGELETPRIDGVLDDEIWSLGEWQNDFIQHS